MKSFAGAVGSAILLALFARLDARLAWLGWVALVPFMATLPATLGRTLAQAWLLTVLFTAAVFGWFASSIADYTHRSPVLVWALLLIGAPLLQPQIMVFALTRLYARSLTAAVCAWSLTELLYPKVLGDTLGYGMYPIAEIRQCADIASVVGITLALLTVNALLAHFTKPAIATAVAIVAAMFIYGHDPAPDTGMPITVGLIQADITNYDALAAERGTYAATDSILGTYERLSKQAVSDGAELIVWPETVYPTTFGTLKSEAQKTFDQRIRKFARPLVFGTYASDGTHEYNAAVVLPGGQTYRKQRLFPFTERAWAAGEATVVADGIAPQICYDVVDPRLARRAGLEGARLLVTLSNDSWLHHGLGPQWSLVVAAFRSVENHLPQARATTDGVSALIDAHGTILRQTREHQREILVGQLLMPQYATPFATWLAPAVAALGIGWTITGTGRRRLLRFMK